METWLAVIILAEMALALLLTWGFMHEDIFVRFEDRLWAKIKKAVRRLIKNGYTR